MVHIDLGVAFEQGKTLRTPELVPFRLTRDLEDAMGVSGVEGVFRRCCEETLRVLRNHRESLITILEVFLHDPLYRWALSPVEALNKQNKKQNRKNSENEESNTGNRDAEKALRRLRQKLLGVESAGVMSVRRFHSNRGCIMIHLATLV